MARGEPVLAGVMPWFWAMARGSAKAGLDALLPPQCLACRGPAAEPGQLCAACWTRADFVTEPMCATCGLPFDHGGAGREAVCGACLAVPPAYDRARSVLRYGEVSRNLILAFKHADRTDAAPAFGAWLGRAGADLLADCDLVAPVPLHRFRLLARRYNQSALLAHAVGRHAGRNVVADLLRRTRATPSQGGLSRHQRWRNVAGAFEVRDRHRTRVAGAAVVLVDDVLTTGATVEACARALRKAGAGRVEVLTLARVVRGDTGGS